MNTDELDSAEDVERRIEAAHAAARRRRRTLLVAAVLVAALLSLGTSVLLLAAGSTLAHVAGYLAAALVATGLLATAARLAPHQIERPPVAMGLALLNFCAFGIAVLHALTITRRWW